MADQTSNSAKVVHIAAGKTRGSTVSLARLPAPVHRVRERSAQMLQQALTNLFDSADDAMFDLADKAQSNQEQNIYFEAMREVRLQRRGMEKDFFLAIDEAFAALLRPMSVAENGFEGEMSIDDLSIVGNEQLEYQVALESMIARALKRVAEPSQHIALRLDSLVPAKVYQQNNPLGPDLLCKAYWSVVERLELNIKAKLILLKLFDKAVVSQLDKIYGVINNFFIQQNILPSLSARVAKGRPMTPVDRPMGGGTAAGTSGSGAAPTAGARAPAAGAQVWENLRGMLSSQHSMIGDGASSAFLDSLESGAPVIESGELSRALTVVQGTMQTRPSGQGEALLDSGQILKMVQQHAQGKVRFSEVDGDVIHLINMMFEFILDDRNLSEPMKALLARLQIPMLKVALEDKSYFNVSGHPARRLLNELATAALGWQEPEKGEPRDPLYRKIHATVMTVLSDFETDIGIFDSLLTDFIAFIEKEQQRAVVLEKRILDAEDGKAKAEQAKAIVSERIALATGRRKLPECVSKILDGPWSNVLFLLLLKYGDDSEEWSEACHTVDDLVWSVTAMMDSEGRSQLMKLLPDLLSRLKKGFELIAFSSFEMNAMLGELEAVHLERLRQMDPPVLTDIVHPDTGTSVDDTDLVSDDSPFSEDDFGDGAQEPQAPGVEGSATAQEPSSQEDASQPQAVSDAWLGQVERLAQGSWFEVSEPDKAPYRCRLAAVIRSVDRYIFVNRNGMKVAEKNRMDLARALEAGEFQMLDDGMLFDRALESVIGNLRASRHSR